MKIKFKFITLFFLGLFLLTGFIANNFEQQVVVLENQVEEFIFKNKISSKKLFYYYALAARNFKRNGHKELALKYYKKALQEKTDDKEHYLKALSEQIFLTEELGLLDELNTEVLKLEKFAIQSGYLKNNPEYQFVIDYFKVIAKKDLTINSIGKEYTYFEETIYYELIIEHEFEVRMKKGLFQEAYSMFLTHQHKISEHELRSAHDLLAYILKKNPSKWYCEDSLREFPSSEAPAIKVCRSLMEKIFYKKSSIFETTLLTKELDYLIPAIKLAFDS